MLQETVEYQRINATWQRWGSYLSARAWGTARENGGDTEKSWNAFPFEHARSRAYRWAEDGIGGFSDEQQRICLAAAFWNEQDPILKERYFGLSNAQGNHGESVKDYFFFLDGTPSYSYMNMLYKYPQVEFPYDRLVHENAMREQDVPAVELIDALPNTFAQNRYFDIFIEYAKADPEDILCRITAINRGDQPAPLHLLPQVWFRRTWNDDTPEVHRPQLRAESENAIRVQHPDVGDFWWYVEAPHELLFTDNETNAALLYDAPDAPRYTKDGIDYAVVRGQRARTNPERFGTKSAAHHVKTLAPDEIWIVRARLKPEQSEQPFADFDAIFEQRKHEADAFYAALQSDDLSEEARAIQRKAFAGLAWNKNFYHFQPSGEAQPGWEHFDAHDLISVPDPWEYPYLALWDLDFQLVTLCIVDAKFAQAQVMLLLSDRYMRSDGALPAFEGDLSTPHPPLHAWAAWHVYHASQRDRDFLQAAYPALKRHFDWWLNTQQHRDQHGEPSYLFGGGYMGMDNISFFNRNEDVPDGAWLAQADSTGWMALFALNLLSMAVELGQDNDAVQFLTHFQHIRTALVKLWDEDDRFFYDRLHLPDGSVIPLRIRSLVGLVPLVAVLLLDSEKLKGLPKLRQALDDAFDRNANGCYLLAAAPPVQRDHLLAAVFDPAEFYSDYGLRSVSKYHEQHPVTLKLKDETYTLRYQPGDADSKLFGGNSNWRGPVWAPLNQLMIEALYDYHLYSSDPLPHAHGMTAKQVALDLVEKLVSLFKRNAQGRRPFFGENTYFQTNPHWRDNLWFYEHFHAETGEGLGASHQNGWTALIARLLHDQGKEVYIPEG